MACWAQTFNSYFCEASDVYMDECYDYPWRPFIHSTGYSDDGKPIPITREAAAKAITNAYKELTLTPEERQARRERSEKIKQEVREYLKSTGFKAQERIVTPADYYITKHGTYSVRCQLIEKGNSLIDLNIAAPNLEAAQSICKKWSTHYQEIYAKIMEELL